MKIRFVVFLTDNSTEEFMKEKKSVCIVSPEINLFTRLIENHSFLDKIVRITCYVFRFLHYGWIKDKPFGSLSPLRLSREISS